MKIKIDDRLKTMNKTRYWLHKETGITYANIVRICNNNTTSIHLETLNKICTVLDCTPNDILK